MGALNTVTEGPSNPESTAYKAARVLARSYVAVLVCVSVLAALSTVLGFDPRIVQPGGVLLSGRAEIPFAGLPALWLTQDRQWFTAWVIVTMVASMLSMPGQIKAMLGSTRNNVESEDAADRPGVNRRLVAFSAWPLILLLVATLPLA